MTRRSAIAFFFNITHSKAIHHLNLFRRDLLHALHFILLESYDRITPENHRRSSTMVVSQICFESLGTRSVHVIGRMSNHSHSPSVKP